MSDTIKQIAERVMALSESEHFQDSIALIPDANALARHVLAAPQVGVSREVLQATLETMTAMLSRYGSQSNSDILVLHRTITAAEAELARESEPTVREALSALLKRFSHSCEWPDVIAARAALAATPSPAPSRVEIAKEFWNQVEKETTPTWGQAAGDVLARWEAAEREGKGGRSREGE